MTSSIFWVFRQTFLGILNNIYAFFNVLINKTSRCDHTKTLFTHFKNFRRSFKNFNEKIAYYVLVDDFMCAKVKIFRSCKKSQRTEILIVFEVFEITKTFLKSCIISFL